MKMLDSLFKGAQSGSKHSLDLKIKTSLDNRALRQFEADLKRIVSLMMQAQRAGGGGAGGGGRGPSGGGGGSKGGGGPGGGGVGGGGGPPGGGGGGGGGPGGGPGGGSAGGGGGGAAGMAAMAAGMAAMGAMRRGRKAAGDAADYVEQKGLSAISFGLGSDAWSFALNSMHKFMELDGVLATLGRRFHSSGRDVGYFGRSLGYTIQQASAMAEELGSKTDRVTERQFKRYAGFARDFGLDPQAVMGVLGGLQQLTGVEINDPMLMSLAGRAQARGMGEGRFQEYLQGLQGFTQQGMEATGRADVGQYASLFDLPAMVFGAQDPRGQGAMGSQFLQGLQGTLTSGGPMQSFLLRAMGFGKQGGPDYIEAKKRLEAGIYDSRNLTDLFGEFRKRGMGKGAQFRALESVSGGQLKAHQIEALVDAVGVNDAGFAALQNMGSDEERQAFIDKAMGRYSETDKDSFAKGGFGEMGKNGDRVGAGEWNAVEVEKMQMELGPKMAEAMFEMRETIVNLAETFKKFFGSDPLDMLVKAAKALSEASEKLKNWMPENAGEKLAEGFTKTLDNAKFGAQFVVSPVATTVGVVTGTIPLPNQQGGGGP